ncbi:MAG: glycosyltransferase family 4 protein [Flavobacteriales bacterium]|nr:glycosyltransferase family 4 protein [Flavobacteriales bacterium]
MPAPVRHAIVVVTNDLSTDNRVDRTCRVLMELGYQVELVGRRLRNSRAIDRPYATKRFRLPFSKGPLFYGTYNLRLVIHLLRRPVDMIVANDLDTLLASWVASTMKKVRLVYDTHEFFTEVPELVMRPGTRRIWMLLEGFLFPRLKEVITVNESIARAYEQRYPNRRSSSASIAVVRNIPMPRDLGPLRSRVELGMDEDAFTMILQGSGINVDRGAEEAVEAMCELPDCRLILVGGGDAWPVLDQLRTKHRLEDRVRMVDRLPYAEMMQFTRNADLGLSLDKDTNLNYRFSLPNKLFDYFAAGIPVLSSDLPEVAGLVHRFQAGVVLPSVTCQAIVQAVRALMKDRSRMSALRVNATFAARELDGRTETNKLSALLGP